MIRKHDNRRDSIKVGAWVLADSKANDAIVAPPREVTKVTNGRVFYTHPERGPTWTTHFNIAYVCDTKEEADAVHALSQRQSAEIGATRKRYDFMLTAMISGSLLPVDPGPQTLVVESEGGHCD